MTSKSIVLLLLFSLSSLLFADNSIQLRKDGAIDIGKSAYVFSDRIDAPRTINSLLSEISEKGIENIPQTQFSGEHIKNNAWVYFSLQNETENENWVMEYDYDRSGKRLTLYEIEKGRITREIEEGNHIPWEQKDLVYRNPAFVLNIGKGETKDYILRFSSPENLPFLTDLQIKLKLWTMKGFIENASSQHLFFGVLLGVAIVMGLYNLILFFSLQQKGYLYFSLFIFFLGFLQLNSYGIIAKWFPTSMNLDYMVGTFFPSLLGIAYILFSSTLLRLRERYPKLLSVLIWSSWVMPLFSLIFQLANILFIMEIRNILLLIYLVIIIILSIIISLRGDRPAQIFLLSNSIFLFFAVIGMLMQIGVLPFSLFLSHSMDLGMIVMIVLFSLALGDEIKIIHNEKEKAKLESDAKTMFLANMSHEMRTPLNGIIGFSELIQNTSDSEEIHRHNEIIRKESNRLHFLINQLLDLSKAEKGKMALDIRPFSLSALLNSIESSFLYRAKQQNLVFSSHFDSNQLSEWYEGDPDRIEQILVNLVGNALKFTEQGSIHVKAEKEHENVKITVADTGIGIEEKDKSKIFGIFNQADQSVSRKYGGTGLGTAIARELTHLMDGEIGFYQNKPSGTVFWISLPLKPTDCPDFSKEKSDLKKEELSGLEGASILLAEDYLANQLIAKRHLESVNCKVDLAENGKIAVEKAAQKKYSLILMDVQMPEMDGLEATSIIKKQGLNRETPVLAMTASAYDTERQKCLSSGMDEVIAKPIRKNSFLKTLLHWIGSVPS